MEVHLGIDTLRAEWPKAVVCVGTFDGVHLGHEAVIQLAVQQARDAELPCVVVTFDRHPATTLDPAHAPPAIATLQENLARFAKLGVSCVLVLPFDLALSRMTATDFLDSVLVGAARADRLVVGHDFAMGHGRVGTAEWLAEHIPTEVVPALLLDGERISSRAIRKAVADGEMLAAARQLGRNYALSGVIVGGQRLGRQLGFPTANLARSTDLVLPADGVYATWFESAQGRFVAATAIGTRPAVQGTYRTVEAFLLDYPGASLYGLAARIEFAQRLRPEQNFASLDDLKAQMTKDVDQVRSILTIPA